MSVLTVSASAVGSLTTHVALYGTRPSETGGFLLAQADADTRLDVLALAGLLGIHRGRDLFKISAVAIERLFTWAGEQELAIRAQVHSHRGGAFLSETDLRHGFAVEGFITSVIPMYGNPPTSPADWGWWSYSAGRWRTLSGPKVTPGGVRTVHFDEDGIHER